MRIVIGGASGFLGQALTARLVSRGDQVVRLVRRPATGGDEVQWDPAAGSVDRTALEGADAIVNLGGVGIGDQRWSEDYKRAILDSRIQVTTTLADAIASLERPGASVLLAGGDDHRVAGAAARRVRLVVGSRFLRQSQ